jgi:leader peptidase (prepilin peptidase) / N-methyltransferase
MVLGLSTLFVGLLGLAFGSFLNVCISRWPDDKSVIKPPSYCPGCERTLAWWENIPAVSWLALRGHCRTCRAPIGLRHLIVELSVGILWAFTAWQTLTSIPSANLGHLSYITLLNGVFRLVFLWLLVGLAALDIENLWLPDRLIWPGIFLGLVLQIGRAAIDAYYTNGGFDEWKHATGLACSYWFLGFVIAAGLLFVIRFLYGVIRGQEGMGMGDVKLMGMIGGWMGARIAIFAFGVGVVSAAIFALILLTNPAWREEWAQTKLPFGAFLAFGGIVAAFWGVPIVMTYMNWAGFS